jgi:hypothetical protein
MSMLRIAVALTIALTTLSQAQSSGKGAKVRFLAERVPAELGEVELAAQEIHSPPFKLPINNLSDPQEAPARAFSVVPQGKTTSLVDVALPEDGKNFIVMLVPASKGYQAIVIADNDPNFKPGDVYFYNHANKSVLGYVGTAKFTLAPGKGMTLRPKGARAEGFYDVGFGVKEKEGNRAISTSRWPVEEQIRSYVFFFVNPSTQRLDFRAVDEFVPPKEP